MKTIIVFIAGVVFLSNAFGNDPGFDMRFKMKTGRDTPAVEARKDAARLSAQQGNAKHVAKCEKQGCCTPTGQAAAKAVNSPGDPGAEARFRMKFGRTIPTADPVLVASSHTCEGACCKHHQSL